MFEDLFLHSTSSLEVSYNSISLNLITFEISSLLLQECSTFAWNVFIDFIKTTSCDMEMERWYFIKAYFIYFSSIFSSNFWVNSIFLIVCMKLNFILMLLGNSFTINMHWRSLKFWYRNFKGLYKTPRKQTKQSWQQQQQQQRW